MASTPSTTNVIRLGRRRFPRGRGASLPFAPEHVFVDRAVSNNPTAIGILERLKGVEVDVIDDVRLLKRPRDPAEGKRRMVLTAHRGRAFKPCQGIGEEHLCCNYRVIDLVSGCPMECSYCILQEYLANNPITTVYVNLEEILAQVSDFLERNPRSFFRVGTGELSDSLALDPITDYARTLVAFFSTRPNAILELKTKTALVEGLLGLGHAGRTVVSWSLNTPSVIGREERDTASLEERFAAAAKVARAGYGIGFHFDPIILGADVGSSVAEYIDVIERMLGRVPAKSIAWVSLGLLRYPPSLHDRALRSFPETGIFAGELVPAGNKMRYPRFMRASVYRPLWDRLAQGLPPHKLYLCMETMPVWGRVDPQVRSSACIEKRVCNAEFLKR